MKIFAENSDSIKREIENIMNSLATSRFKEIKKNIEQLEVFSRVLVLVSGETNKEATDTIERLEKYTDENKGYRRILKRQRSENFVNDKDFHYDFSGKVLDMYQKGTLNHYRERRLYLSEDYMSEIICDFLDSEFNQADSFRKLVDEGRILRFNPNSFGKDEEMPAGMTAFNYSTKDSFIITASEAFLLDVSLMRVLVHEFGHTIDNFDKRYASVKDIDRYYWISPYVEVYSLLYEKLFLEYLIKHNIFKEDSLNGIKEFHSDIYDKFREIRYLSSLSDSLLINERYRTVGGLMEQIEMNDEKEFLLCEEATADFNDAFKYSYSGVLANYFAYLKHHDPELFRKTFLDFKNKRFNGFNPNIFEDIGTNPDEIIKILENDSNGVSTKKKLILE